MEEKKQKTEVGQDVPTVTITAKEYEDLRTEVVRARAFANDMAQRMNEMSDALIEKRTQFLFKVVENELRFDDSFVAYCKDEIKKTLTPVEEEKKKDE